MLTIRTLWVIICLMTEIGNSKHKAGRIQWCGATMPPHCNKKRISRIG
jgi:hypothetical protein